jgi:catechol 2,3-dioxygenase-like lactoylglutathione lyase family enzyme
MKRPRKQRVTGIGGIFFKASDPDSLRAWYVKHLGLPVEAFGYVVFTGTEKEPSGAPSHTVWNPFPADTDYFAPGKASFMINFRVADLDAMLKQLKKEGVKIDPKGDDSEFGKFAWVMDPEGNRIELWEPPVPPRPAKKAPRRPSKRGPKRK